MTCYLQALRHVNIALYNLCEVEVWGSEAQSVGGCIAIA